MVSPLLQRFRELLVVQPRQGSPGGSGDHLRHVGGNHQVLAERLERTLASAASTHARLSGFARTLELGKLSLDLLLFGVMSMLCLRWLLLLLLLLLLLWLLWLMGV